jgi:hypothetical protein
MWSTDSRWFDVAAFTTLWAALVVVFSPFEQHSLHGGGCRSAQRY